MSNSFDIEYIGDIKHETHKVYNYNYVNYVN